MKWRMRRRARLEASIEAIAKQDRLAPYIQMQKQDASELGEWALDRLRKNHLSQLFIDHHGRGVG